MIKALCLALITVASAGCATSVAQQTHVPPEHSWEYAPHQLTPQQVATIKAQVPKLLADPKSADFVEINARKATISPTQHAFQVCGKVRARVPSTGVVQTVAFIGAFPMDRLLHFEARLLLDGDKPSVYHEACRGMVKHLAPVAAPRGVASEESHEDKLNRSIKDAAYKMLRVARWCVPTMGNEWYRIQRAHVEFLLALGKWSGPASMTNRWEGLIDQEQSHKLTSPMCDEMVEKFARELRVIIDTEEARATGYCRARGC